MKNVIKKPSVGFSESLLALTLASFALLGCQKVPAKHSSVAASTISRSEALSSGGLVVAIYDASGHLIFSDASPSTKSSLRLVEGQPYTLHLSQVNAAPGTVFHLVLTQINVINQPNHLVNLVLGDNNFSVDSQGDYEMRVVASRPDGTEQSSSYLAEVSCTTARLTATGLDATKIRVTEVSTNLFNLSAADVVAQANGLPPYTCAWDPTGTGIRDTGFSDCATPVTNFYSNFLGVRKVGLLVKDSCNTIVELQGEANFVSAEPPMPGSLFISGRTSKAGGVAVGDPRVDGVDYLATNATNHNVVYANYTPGGFRISASQSYFMSKSANFGIQLQLSGLSDNIDLPNMTGSVNTSAAKILNVSFSTDQADDKTLALSFSKSNCALTDQGAKVTFDPGAPCASGWTGDAHKATIEVWGHYRCSPLTTVGGAIDLEGDFDGKSSVADSCKPVAQPAPSNPSPSFPSNPGPSLPLPRPSSGVPNNSPPPVRATPIKL